LHCWSWGSYCEYHSVPPEGEMDLWMGELVVVIKDGLGFVHFWNDYQEGRYEFELEFLLC